VRGKTVKTLPPNIHRYFPDNCAFSVETILISQLIVPRGTDFFCLYRVLSTTSCNSVPDRIVGWPRSTKKLVTEGGHTLPLSPCQVDQHGYFSSASWQIKYRTKSSTREKLSLGQAQDETPRTRGQFCFFFSPIVSICLLRSSLAYQTYTQSGLCLVSRKDSGLFPLSKLVKVSFEECFTLLVSQLDIYPERSF